MKIKKENLAIIIAVLLIAAFVLAEVYSVINVELVTQSAVETTVYETVDATALAVRKENEISAPSSGVVVPIVSEGEKVKTGGVIAKVFSSEQEALNYSNLINLQNELDYYNTLESRTIGEASDVAALDDEIEDDVNNYIRSVASGKPEIISDSSSKMNDVFTRRQLLIGENINFSEITGEIKSQMREIKQQGVNPSGSVTTDVSGNFSSKTDGFENLVDYDNVENLTVNQVNELINKASEVNNGSSFGKLITDFNWYLVCVADCSKISGISNGDTVELNIKSSGTVLKTILVSGGETALGQKQTVLVFKCNDMSADCTSLRVEDIEIRMKSYTGVKVPANAIHINDSKQGVYTLVSNQVKFREADVVYTAKDYVLLSFGNDSENGIKLYDKIIIEGKDLYDGKVFT